MLHQHGGNGGAGGDGSTLERCSPDGVAPLRAFTRSTVMDVLYYAAAASSGQRIIDAISAQLHAKYVSNSVRLVPTASHCFRLLPTPRDSVRLLRTPSDSFRLLLRYAAFRADRPGWHGRVSILGHSLGSVLMLDMLTHAGTTFQGIRYPALPFECDCFFALGSPAALFLVARHNQHPDEAAAAPARQAGARPKCRQMVNVVNAVDPISYLCVPLAASPHEGGIAKAAPVAALPIPPAKSLAAAASPLEIARFVRDHPATTASGAGGRNVRDVVMPSKWTLSDTLNAASSHSAYWFLRGRLD